jgi:hypothetical protein
MLLILLKINVICQFHNMPKWNEIVSAKVNSFENFHYRPHGNNFKVMFYLFIKL